MYPIDQLVKSTFSNISLLLVVLKSCQKQAVEEMQQLCRCGLSRGRKRVWRLSIFSHNCSFAVNNLRARSER